MVKLQDLAQKWTKTMPVEIVDLGCMHSLLHLAFSGKHCKMYLIHSLFDKLVLKEEEGTWGSHLWKGREDDKVGTWG